MSGRDDSGYKHTNASDGEVLEQRLYDPDHGPDLTTIIIEAVAAAEGEDLMTIREPPLYEVVDIAAVKDALFGAQTTDERGVTAGSLSFEYRMFCITVRGDGWVQVAHPVGQ